MISRTGCTLKRNRSMLICHCRLCATFYELSPTIVYSVVESREIKPNQTALTWKCRLCSAEYVYVVCDSFAVQKSGLCWGGRFVLHASSKLHRPGRVACAVPSSCTYYDTFVVVLLHRFKSLDCVAGFLLGSPCFVTANDWQISEPPLCSLLFHIDSLRLSYHPIDYDETQQQQQQ